ncbi:sugar ABC transporter substrate-binding protein [Paenibacillus sp. GCM10012307]|uniref:sugar ABC transporter substrate-binding protein n=1 Tax=Paenibacillus TaxID=44249 RepID=UPI001E450538|nr:sugar ABC transporter substrate-binding protein [Paenibacillus roseus]
MKKWGKSSILLLIAAFMLVVSACGSKPADNTPPASNAGKENSAGAENSDLAKLKGKKIALIMQFNQGTFSAQYIDGVKEQAAKFGGEVQVFASENDLGKMVANLDSAINQGFDAILTDHGEAAALEPGIKRAVEKNIPVVAFDADVNVPGVTVVSQDDQKMAEVTLEQLAQDAGGQGSIVKIWVAGFAPMERRQIAYKAFQEKYPDLKEISAFGNANNPQLDAQQQMEAVLTQYPKKGEITAVWAAWDEFAKGASRAIQAAGRDEIKVYGIDMSDEDLQIIQDPATPWVASAAVDPKDIGRVQVRYAYQKLHGDTTDDKVVLPPTYVKREDLPKQPEKVNTTDLHKFVEGWGASKQGWVDWMEELEKIAAK